VTEIRGGGTGRNALKRADASGHAFNLADRFGQHNRVPVTFSTP